MLQYRGRERERERERERDEIHVSWSDSFIWIQWIEKLN